MMEQLRDLVTPADDGRGFTDAVLLRASGALARRRMAAAEGPTWSLLELWARPWLIAALLALALAVAYPAWRGQGTEPAYGEYGLAGTLLAAREAEVVLRVALGN